MTQLTHVMHITHPVRLQTPFYAVQSDDTGRGGALAGGAQLHRYFEPEFINRFERDLHKGELAQQGQWQREDAFSRFDKKPVLRLPMHKSFYLVSCEILCDRPGRPALDPEKIHSAGFVIRRLGPGGEQSWMLQDDEPQGWQGTPTGLRDPDLSRRLSTPPGAVALAGVPRFKWRHPGANAGPNLHAYTGEQTHPMHATTTFDAQGRCHTLLYGYVPLGGSYTLRTTSASAFDADSMTHFASAVATQLYWPFGFKPLKGAAVADQTWTDDCARPVNKAVPSLAFFELLKALVNRYHLCEQSPGDTEDTANQALLAWAQQQFFYESNVHGQTRHAQREPRLFNDFSRAAVMGAARITLAQYLREQFANEANPLVAYMAVQEQRLENHQPLEALPGVSDYSLFISPGDAQEIRALLEQRLINHAVGKAREIPLPKFGQGRDDVYQIVPFVRLRRDCGGEEILWGDATVRSEVFRVAAPFDPHASRPSLIQMPSLRDLRSGMARGVSMITPADTFSLMNALNLKKGASEEVLPSETPAGLGIQWICSFSLPVITLVAMILLMIMISLLNIVFFWLPWVRICLPFPSVKKE